MSKYRFVAFAIAISFLVSLQAATAKRQGSREHRLGQSVFSEHCVKCHGADASGGDLVTVDRGVKAYAPDLRLITLVNGHRYPWMKVEHFISGEAHDKDHRFSEAFRRRCAAATGASAEEMCLFAVNAYVQSLQLKAEDIGPGTICYGCKRIIHEPELIARVVDREGQEFGFRNPSCLARYLKTHPEHLYPHNAEEIAAEGRILVTDFNDSGRLLPAAEASFVLAPLNGDPAVRVFHAFGSTADARRFAREHDTSLTSWEGVLDVTWGSM